MANIKEKTNKIDMRLHIDKAFEFIDEHLPESYVAEVYKKLPKDTLITAAVIRNVRVKKPTPLSIPNLEIVNAMVEVAKDFKIQKEKLLENIS